MNTSIKDESDPIIRAVMDFNKSYKNTGYNKSAPLRLGRCNIYTVWFIGQDAQSYTQYVFEGRGRTQVYHTMEQLLQDRSNGVIPAWTDPQTLQLIIVSIITILLILAIIFIAIEFPDKTTNLQALIGLAGAGLGWLVGTGGVHAK
jgi:hypothetical protein